MRHWVRAGKIRTIAARDGLVCWLCDRAIARIEEASLDHVITKKNGGSYANENLRLSHHDCNRIRGDLEPEAGRERVKGWLAGTIVLTQGPVVRRKQLHEHILAKYGEDGLRKWLRGEVTGSRESRRVAAEVARSNGVPGTALLPRGPMPDRKTTS